MMKVDSCIYLYAYLLRTSGNMSWFTETDETRSGCRAVARAERHDDTTARRFTDQCYKN